MLGLHGMGLAKHQVSHPRTDTSMKQSPVHWGYNALLSVNRIHQFGAMEDNSARREHILRTWVRQQIGDWLDWQTLPGDASFRRYHRLVIPGSTLLVMDAPPPQEDCRRFVWLARVLRDLGLHTPAILAHEPVLGFALLEDLGETTYLDVLQPDNATVLYQEAWTALLRLQRAPLGSMLPRFDTDYLARELTVFREWYLERHLGLDPAGLPTALLDAAFGYLIQQATSQPHVAIHRDYHSRNLLPATDTTGPGIIDFQDALLGPVTYDIISLLKDCYIAWPQEQVTDWALRYWHEARQAGIPMWTRAADFLTAFDAMGTQRHLKAIGYFARLCHRDHKRRYLADIPRVLGYIQAACARLPELSAFGDWLMTCSAPLLQQPAMPIPGHPADGVDMA